MKANEFHELQNYIAQDSRIEIINDVNTTRAPKLIDFKITIIKTPILGITYIMMGADKVKIYQLGLAKN